MAELSKVTDSRLWFTNVDVGSNPSPDNVSVAILDKDMIDNLEHRDIMFYF